MHDELASALQVRKDGVQVNPICALCVMRIKKEQKKGAKIVFQVGFLLPPNHHVLVCLLLLPMASVYYEFSLSEQRRRKNEC